MGRKRKNGNGDVEVRTRDSFLVKYFLRLIVALSVILTFLTLVQCSVKETKSSSSATLPTVLVDKATATCISNFFEDDIVADSHLLLTSAKCPQPSFSIPARF